MAKKNSSNHRPPLEEGQERDFWSFIDSVSSRQQSLSRSLSISSAGTEKIYYSYDQFPFTLVLDAEACLHVLYGRAFSDWICGGQWSQMMKFLDALFRTLRESNVCPLIYLNGSHEPPRFKEWVKHQKQMKSNANRIFRHLHRRAIPPPKAWWIPPSGLRSVLRLGLLTLNTPIFSSLDDHYLDMMDFVWKNNFQGVLGSHQDLIFFKPLRLFSARSLRLSKELNILSTEYNLEGVAKSLDLNPVRFCLLGALLGNHILTTQDLSEFHALLVPDIKHCKNKASVLDKVIRGVINYVRKLPSIDDHVKIGHDVFQSAKDSSDPRFQKLKESIEYYSLGARNPGKRQGKLEPHFQRGMFYSEPKSGIQIASADESITLNDDNDNVTTLEVTNESDDREDDSSCPHDDDGKTVVPSLESVTSASSQEVQILSMAKDEEVVDELSIKILPIPEEVRRTAADRHRHGAMSPYIYQVISYGEIKFPVILENMRSHNHELFPRIHEFYRPLRQSVYAILFNLHHHQFAKRQREDTIRSLESSISVLVAKSEDSEMSEDNKTELTEKLEKLKKELNDLLTEAHGQEDPQIRIREWVPYNLYQKPVIVTGLEVPWGIPTIQRLWFGTSQEDKEKRIRAFMSCMRCDNVKPLLLQTAIIPAHLLFMSCILRYIMMSSPVLVLKKPELDAFILTSVRIGSFHQAPPPPHLDIVTPRGVQLASLFMEGVEMALFANDVCGAPLPLHMTLPWTFFNGALFQSILRKAGNVRNLYELCDRNEELVSRVEIMKSAIIPELMNMNEGLLGHPKRSTLENGHAWHLQSFPFSNGRLPTRKKGGGFKGKSVSVVNAKKSESKNVKIRSSPIKTKEMNGESSLAH